MRNFCKCQTGFIDKFGVQVHNVARGDKMLGEKIRSLRKDNGISQEELAEKLGVSRQSVSLWENGQTMPSMDSIVAIAKIFNVSTDLLLNNDIGIETEEKLDLPKEQDVPQQEMEETTFDNADEETQKDSTAPSKRSFG